MCYTTSKYLCRYLDLKVYFASSVKEIQVTISGNVCLYSTANNVFWSPCPENWVLIKQKCYLLNTENTLSFDDAKAYCGNLGGKLFEPTYNGNWRVSTISIPYEVQFVFSILPQKLQKIIGLEELVRTQINPSFPFWIGITDIQNEGE